MAANDTAVVLGALGVVVVLGGVASGVGTLVGVEVGAVLAVSSFGAWWVGNRYQRLADDPSRTDFDQVTICGAQVIEANLPRQEPDATTWRLAATHLVLVDAVDALVTSLERWDGAVAAGDIAAGDIAAADSQADAAQLTGGRPARRRAGPADGYRRPGRPVLGSTRRRPGRSPARCAARAGQGLPWYGEEGYSPLSAAHAWPGEPGGHGATAARLNQRGWAWWAGRPFWTTVQAVSPWRGPAGTFVRTARGVRWGGQVAQVHREGACRGCAGVMDCGRQPV